MQIMTKLTNFKQFLVLVSLGVLLAGCRGEDQNDPGSFPVTANPDSFALFLNQAPAVPKEGAQPGAIDNVEDFPEAYYNTIDPNNTRDSFLKWRIENGFLNADGSPASCELPNCVSTHVKFRDTKDLGYGRNMFLRWNKATGDVAVYVENFQVDAVPGVPYGPLNLEALVEGDREWNFGVNAIEFSAFPQPAGSRQFTKFYNFSGDGKQALLTSGSQQHFVDLDGRGLKSMPTPCIVCHGGHGRTLVVENSAGIKVVAPTIPGGIPGDVHANMQTIELNTLQFADAPGFTQEENEEGIRLINEAILSSFQQRKNTAQTGDWDPDFAIEIASGRYNGSPSSVGTLYNENFVPSEWRNNPNAESIYNNLVGPNCMVCHALRGTNLNNSISFQDFDEFLEYSEQIDHLTFERGLMPLGLLNYSEFWESGKRNPALLAAAIGHGERINADNTAVKPGAPVATVVAPITAAGISASGETLDIPISAAGSAFAASGTFSWTVDSPALASVVVQDQTTGAAVLRANQAGDYTVTLAFNGVNGGTATASQQINVVAESPTLPASDEITFYDASGAGIYDMLQTNGCDGCHTGASGIPISYEPCDAAGLAGDAQQGFDFLYRSVLARVNFDAPLDSLFVRKPINGATDITDREGTQIDTENGIPLYHDGGLVLGSGQDEDVGRLISWILSGAERGDLPPASDILPGATACL